MAGLIPQGFIDELVARSDIVELIGSRVPLKKAGREYKACCPFHDEKTPSFWVSPDKQFYHCFGCGAHGSALGFLMQHDQLPFPEAVEELANRLGLEVPHEGGSAVPRASEELTDLLGRVAGFYQERLAASEPAQAYLRGRGLDAPIIERFRIGYAPDSWNEVLRNFGATDEARRALLATGLIIERESARAGSEPWYDRFRDRVMFPIRDPRGRVLGFGGRLLAAGEPKYLNSPETTLFHKGQELYGLHEIRLARTSLKRLIVVEGYMDVVRLHQAGVAYAVATLGTATTPWQVQKLLRQTDNVVYCFDGDAAGRRAAWRALENSLAQLQDGKQVRFLFLPPEDDPDSFVRAHGKEAFGSLLEAAPPLSAYLVQELTSRADMRTVEGRAKFLQEAKPLVKQVPAPMLSLMLRKQIAELAGVSQAELDRSFEIKSKNGTQVPERRQSTKPSLIRALVEMLAFQPSLAALADSARLRENADLTSSELPQSELNMLTKVLELCVSQSNVRSVAEHFRGTEFEPLAHEIEAGSLKLEDLDQEALQAEFVGAWE